MPYYETEYHKGQRVRIKGERGIFIIVDDPTDQSIATCRNDVESPANCTLMDESLVDDPAFTFKPVTTAFLRELRKLK